MSPLLVGGSATPTATTTATASPTATATATPLSTTDSMSLVDFRFIRKSLMCVHNGAEVGPGLWAEGRTLGITARVYARSVTVG